MRGQGTNRLGCEMTNAPHCGLVEGCSQAEQRGGSRGRSGGLTASEGVDDQVVSDAHRDRSKNLYESG